MTGGSGCGADAGASSGVFIAAAKGESKAMPGGVTAGAGVETPSGDFAVKRLVMDTCGEEACGEAGVNEESLAVAA